MDTEVVFPTDRLAEPVVPALAYDGRVGELYPIFLLNLVLTILTIGIYRFWGVTRLRRYIWSHFRFQGERLEYVGTGGELFRGLLLALLALLGAALVLAVLVFIAGNLHPALALFPMLLFYIGISVLVGAAPFQAQRYRLSRTVWCGIRGGMHGSSLRYGVRALWYWTLLLPTLALLLPWTSVWLARRRIGASWFGSLNFSCEAKGGRLFGVYLATVLVSLVVLAAIGGAAYSVVAPALQALAAAKDPNDPAQVVLASQLNLVIAVGFVVFGAVMIVVQSWFRAAYIREIASHTTLGGVAFTSTASGSALALLLVGNALILLFTLGLGYPVVLQRDARFIAATLRASGTLDAAMLAQSAELPPTVGEGWFQLFDHVGVL